MSRTKLLMQKTMEPPSIKALPVNLPRTFLPERRLLTQLMRFAAANGQATGKTSAMPPVFQPEHRAAR